MRRQYGRAKLRRGRARGLGAPVGGALVCAPEIHIQRYRMIRPTFAALMALGLSATASLAQPPASANPTAAATASRRDTPDEPAANPGANVERRSERGQAAAERKISDVDIATAPVHEAEKTSHRSVTVNGR